MRKQLKPGEAVNIMAEKVWVTQPKKKESELMLGGDKAPWHPGDFLIGVLCGVVAAFWRMAA